MATRERLRQLIKERPHMIRADLARQLGVTPALVWQLAKSEGWNIPKSKGGRPRKHALAPTP